MSDHEAIRQLIYEFAAAADDRDLDRVLDCFAESAQVSLNGGAVIADGKEQIRAMYEVSLGDAGIGQHGSSTHAMSNVIIELGDMEASAEVSGTATIARPDWDVVAVRGLRYSIDLSRHVSHGWKISTLRHRAIWQYESPQVDPVGGLRHPKRRHD